MSIILAIFVIGCLTVLAFIGMIIYMAFFMKEKPQQKWIAPETKIRKYNMYRGKAL